MTAFLESEPMSNDPVRVLGTVRRSAMRGPNGYRHPFYWASYAITLNNF